MKKIISIVISFILIIGTFTACNKKEEKEEATPKDSVYIYTINDGEMIFVEAPVSLATPETIWGQFEKVYKIKDEKIKIKYEKIEEKHYVDFSEEFYTYLSKLDSEKETDFIHMLSNTLLSSLSIDELYLTVNGNCLKTENNEYKNPQTFFNPNKNADKSQNDSSTALEGSKLESEDNYDNMEFKKSEESKISSEELIDNTEDFKKPDIDEDGHIIDPN